MNFPSIGINNTSGNGFSSGGNSGANIRAKLSELEKQRDEYNKQLSSAKDKDKRELQNKIASLENRMGNLESRLEKLNKDNEECQTCKNRKYQDGSDDPGVSFKSAAKIAPEAAAATVRGHEMEHVYRNQAKAAREGKKVVSQSVVLKSAICPECGKAYISGGETRTVTRTDNSEKFNAGIEKDPKGSLFDMTA